MRSLGLVGRRPLFGRALVGWLLGVGILSAAIFGVGRLTTVAAEPKADEVFRRENLVAWCIVPFDDRNRPPEERAQMLKRLGLRKFAYDYRAEHVPQFETEIQTLKRHGIELTAWWFPTQLNNEARLILDVLKRNDVRPQLWVTGGGGPTSTPEEQAARVKSEAARIRPIAEAAAAQGCRVELYNHGGWFGEPENQVAIIRELNLPNVGIVYNLHHGHSHMARLDALLALMKPHLDCFNLNGMMPNGDARGRKIMPIGEGEQDLEWVAAIRKSGYTGPIGILNHTQENAEHRLQDNLDGLAWLLAHQGNKAPGPKPLWRSFRPTPPPMAGVLLEQPATLRQLPLTVDLEARLDGKETYNILVAADTKASGKHWELFTEPGTGHITLYRPGWNPDHLRTQAAVCDGKPHRIRLVLDANGASLVVDDQAAGQVEGQPIEKPMVPGQMAIGRLVEEGAACQGQVNWLRISRGVLMEKVERLKPTVNDPSTLLFWPTLPAGKNAGQRRTANRPVLDGNGGAVFVEATGDDVGSDAPVPRTFVVGVGAPCCGKCGTGTRGLTFDAGLLAAADDAAAGGASAKAPAREYSAELVQRLIATANSEGQRERGQSLFAGHAAACLTCHKVGTLGGDVGPALGDLVARKKPEEIVEAVLWPNRTVAAEFALHQIQTTDGRLLSLYKVAETPEQMEFRDPRTGEKVTLRPDDIEEMVVAGTLMPNGLVDAWPDKDIVDLVRFLTSLGAAGSPPVADVQVALARIYAPQALKFPFEPGPLRPADWRNTAEQVNRDRVYDFYGKEADYFRDHAELFRDGEPALLAPFPGLDGGLLGHWGNQNETVWRDSTWMNSVFGSVQCGILRLNGKILPRAVCIQLPPREGAGRGGAIRSVVLNAASQQYVAAWEGGFVNASPVRQGLNDPLTPQGMIGAVPKTIRLPTGAVYRGFYRSGDRVLPTWRVGETQWLDSIAAGDNGGVTVTRAPLEDHAEKTLTRGGAAQWPDVIETPISHGTETPYAIDTVGLPEENPWKAPCFCAGHGFTADGVAYVLMAHGDVWRVDGLAWPSKTARWKRFASGLNQPLGLWVDADGVFVLCRDQITRLHDFNGDQEADFYECYSQAFRVSGGGHDYNTGLERDREGRFYFASGADGLVRIEADGKSATVIASGFRNPDGLGLYPDGTVTVPCSEGDWTPASTICVVPPDALSPTGMPPHYGYGGPKAGNPPMLPLLYLPRGVDNSPGGQVWVDSDRWGPMSRQMLHLSWGTGTLGLLLRDNVRGQEQGAYVPLPGDFDSGIHRGRVSPVDGQLYVCGCQGWGSYTPRNGCFQRMRYSGGSLQRPIGWKAHENGVLLTFVEPVDTAVAGQAGSHFAQVWNYRYSRAYGSPEFSTRIAGRQGHDRLAIRRAVVLEGGKQLFLEIPELQPAGQLHLRLKTGSEEACDLFATVHALDVPFNQFEGYEPVQKVVGQPSLLNDLRFASKTVKNPNARMIVGSRPVTLETGTNLSYAQRELKVKAGEALKFTLANADTVPHNWVLVKPGRLPAVVAEANQLIADPEAWVRHYIPSTKDVLAYTDVVDPGARFTIQFHAPKEPGVYPFVCTFPGHSLAMNGVMVVEE